MHSAKTKTEIDADRWRAACAARHPAADPAAPVNAIERPRTRAHPAAPRPKRPSLGPISPIVPSAEDGRPGYRDPGPGHSVAGSAGVTASKVDLAIGKGGKGRIKAQ